MEGPIVRNVLFGVAHFVFVNPTPQTQYNEPKSTDVSTRTKLNLGYQGVAG